MTGRRNGDIATFSTLVSGWSRWNIDHRRRLDEKLSAARATSANESSKSRRLVLNLESLQRGIKNEEL